ILISVRLWTIGEARLNRRALRTPPRRVQVGEQLTTVRAGRTRNAVLRVSSSNAIDGTHAFANIGLVLLVRRIHRLSTPVLLFPLLDVIAESHRLRAVPGVVRPFGIVAAGLLMPCASFGAIDTVRWSRTPGTRHLLGLGTHRLAGDRQLGRPALADPD